MKRAAIKVGRTYRNRGKGATQRKVLDIFCSCCTEKVEFEQRDRVYILSLDSFAQWAGSEVTDGDAVL